MKGLTNGWQVNSLMTFHGGAPFSVYSSSDYVGHRMTATSAPISSGRQSVQGLPKGGVVA